MAKTQLIFDASDAETLAASDIVGAIVRTASGVNITATGTALDVSIDNASIVVTATDLDIRDLTAASDSVESWTHDGTGNAITSTAGALDVNLKSPITVDVSLDHANDSVKLGDGTNLVTVTNVGADYGLDVNIINASIAVTATDLDIRDLAFATDSVTAHQGGTWNIGTLTSITNDVNIADGGNSITVDAVDFDIRDLSAATDSVSAWTKDGSGNAITSTAGALDVNITNSLTVNDAALANSAILSTSNSLDVANTAEAVVASALANRKYLFIYNNSNKKTFIGNASVTQANGFPVDAGSYIELRAGASVAVNWIAPDAGQNIRTLELA